MALGRHAMEFAQTSAIFEFYTSGFDFDHITAVDMSFCTRLRNFIHIGSPSAEKNDIMSILKMAEIRHLENRHDVIFFLHAEGGLILIKFRSLVQNDMSTAAIWSKLKP